MTISPRGGTSRLLDAVTITVPEGAVEADTTFTGTPAEPLGPVDPDAGLVVAVGDAFEVTASGPLSSSVGVAVDVAADLVPSGADASKLFLAAAGPGGTGLEIAGNQVAEGDTAVGADTTHLSRWQPFAWVPEGVSSLSQGILAGMFGPAAGRLDPPSCRFADGTSASVSNGGDSDLDVCVTSLQGTRGTLRVFNRRSHSVTVSFGEGTAVVGSPPRGIPDHIWQWAVGALGGNVVVPAGSEVTFEVPLAAGSGVQLRAIADLGSLLLNLSTGVAKFFAELKLKLVGGAAADVVLIGGQLFQCAYGLWQEGSAAPFTAADAREGIARAVDVIMSCSGQLGELLGGTGWLLSLTALASSIFKATAATFDTGAWIVTGDRIITAERKRPAQPPPTSAAEDPVKAAIEFFKSQKAACDRHADRTGNPRVPAGNWDWLKPFTDVHPDPNRIWIVDGAGNILTVYTARRIVTGENGPEDLLPIEYEFGCPPEVFVAPAHD